MEIMFLWKVERHIISFKHWLAGENESSIPVEEATVERLVVEEIVTNNSEGGAALPLATLQRRRMVMECYHRLEDPR
jgi:hypothetical protein